MTITGDIAKGILIFGCGYFAFIILVQALMGQAALAVFMLIGFIIPLAIILHGHMQDRKDEKKNNSSPIKKTGQENSGFKEIEA